MHQVPCADRPYRTSFCGLPRTAAPAPWKPCFMFYGGSGIQSEGHWRTEPDGRDGRLEVLLGLLLEVVG